MEGVMDIYITNLETKEKLRIPMLPQEIRVKIGNKFASYSILRNGEVKIPTGPALDTISWTAYFPGKLRKKEPYVRKWKAPKKCDKFLRNLKAIHGNAVEAKLLVTGTNIHLNVYLQDYSPVETGGLGDVSYSVTFIRAKALTVKESSQAEAEAKDADDGESEGKGENSKTTVKSLPKSKEEERTTSSSSGSGSYTVRSGDSLWAIAQREYGDGSLYTKIRDANKSVISKHGSNPNMIWPGDVLTIP